MGVLIRNGGGNSKIKVDGIPPKKKMEIESMGNEDYLNFIKIKNNNHSLYEILSINKINENLYVFGNTSQTNPKMRIEKYNLINGFDSKYTVTTTNSYSPSGGRYMLFDTKEYKENQILIVGANSSLASFNVDTKEITEMFDIGDIINTNCTILEINKKIYLIRSEENYASILYEIDIEGKQTTRIAYFEKNYLNAFIHENKIWINFDDSSTYSLFALENGTQTQGAFPVIGKCIKINNKIHLFSLNNEYSPEHYVYKNGQWEKKASLTGKVEIQLYTGKESDVGFIQTAMETETNKATETFTIITDKLFLEKRRE